MINYKLLKEHGIIPKKIIKNKNTYIIESQDKNKYVVKKECKELNEKFNYLKSRNFNNFPNHSKLKDYDIFSYIENAPLEDEETLSEIIDLISLLHTKTTRYKTVDIDDYKIIYEDLEKEITTSLNYYQELNDIIDTEIYMSPSHYLLALNISKIYGCLSFCMEELDNWYDLIKDAKTKREAFIHNNLDLTHLIRDKNPYLISWNNSKIDFPFYDLLTLYNKYSNKTDFKILLDSYQKRYPLKEEELKLLFIKLSIPKKIELSNNEYQNTKEVKSLIEKIERGDKLIRPYYEKITN